MIRFAIIFIVLSLAMLLLRTFTTASAGEKPIDVDPIDVNPVDARSERTGKARSSDDVIDVDPLA